MRLPDDPAAHRSIGTELATINGITYVSLPDGVALPSNQPAEIAASIGVVTLTPALRDAIRAASPHAQLINSRMVERIRAKYTIDDEMYYARIGVGAANSLYAPTAGELQEMAAFGVFVESVRQWGRDQRAALGI